MDVLINDLTLVGHRLNLKLVDHFLQILQSCVSADWNGVGSGNLHAVVLFGVVACCYLNRSVRLKVYGCKINHRCGCKADVPYIDSCVVDSLAEILEDLITCESDVTTDNDILAGKKLRKEESYLVGCVLVEIFVVDTTDIVCFKYSHFFLLFIFVFEFFY